MPRPVVEGGPRYIPRRQLFKRAAASVAWSSGITSLVAAGFDVVLGSLKSIDSAYSPDTQNALIQRGKFQQGMEELAREGKLSEAPLRFDQTQVQTAFDILDNTKREQTEALIQVGHGVAELAIGVAAMAAGGTILENMRREENGSAQTPTPVFPSSEAT